LSTILRLLGLNHDSAQTYGKPEAVAAALRLFLAGATTWPLGPHPARCHRYRCSENASPRHHELMSDFQGAVGTSDVAPRAHARPRGPGWPAATIGAIGTSPIYTIQTIFNPEDPHPVAVSPVSVYGLLSLVFWSVTIIVTVL
jgi:hypothetical protein